MKPEIYNFKKNYSQTTFKGRQFFFTDENDIPIDITGWVFRMQIRKSINGLIVKSLTNGNGFTIIDATAGIVRMDSFKVMDLAINYVYDLIIDKPNGITTPYLKGLFEVEDNITKDD